MSAVAIFALAVFLVSYLLIATERINKVKAALGGPPSSRRLGSPDPTTCSTPTRPGSTGTSSPAAGHDGDRRRPAPHRGLRVHRHLGGQTCQRFGPAGDDPAGPDHRGRLGPARQCHHGPAHRPGHPAGLRTPGCQPGSVPRSPRSSHPTSAARPPGRRPSQHHHRQPGGLVLQRLPGTYGPAGPHRARSVPGPAPADLPGLIHRGIRPGPRGDVAQRTRGHPRRPAADQVPGSAGGGVRRVPHPLDHPHRTGRGGPARRGSSHRDHRSRTAALPGQRWWETLLFFAGLFILVGALVKTGSSARSRSWRVRPPEATRCRPPWAS